MFKKDMWGGRMSLSEIWDVIQNLPPDSAVVRKVDPHQWRAINYQLADLFDLTLMLNTERPKSGPDKRPFYQRPEGEDRKRQREEAEARQTQRLLEQQAMFQKQLAAGGDF